tara:strand:- start:150 stop:305 length:156 start_codon:yes stop_codon:yes gene_type:complete
MAKYKSFNKVLDNDLLNRTLEENSKLGWDIYFFEVYPRDGYETYLLILRKE